MSDLWDMETARQFSKALDELETAHRTKLDDFTRELYLQHLSILSLEQFKDVVKISPQICRTFPSIADILEMAGIDPPKVQTEREAEAEWRVLRSGKKQLHELTLKNISLKIVNEMGGRGTGPLAFGRWASDQERFKKKEFTKRYAELRREMEVEEIRPQLKIEVQQEELAKLFTNFREWDTPFAGLSEYDKGQIIDTELKRKTEAGEAIYKLESDMFFAYWAEPIPLSEKSIYGEKTGAGWWSKTGSKDKALVRNYEHTPKPATLFGNIGRGMKDE